VRFDPSTDVDIAAALKAAVEAGVPRSLIDRELVEAVTIEPDDDLRPVILAGRLYRLARGMQTSDYARVTATRSPFAN
jgi:hypothetical protein